MPKGIQGCLLVITGSKIKLCVSEVLAYLGPLNTPALLFSVLSLGNFSHKKMLSYFSLLPSWNFPWVPIEYAEVAATIYMDLHSFLQVYMIYINSQFF